MKRKTIAVTEDVYEELLAHKSELQMHNSKLLTFSDTIDLLFTELAGNEYAAAADQLKASGYRYEG